MSKLRCPAGQATVEWVGLLLIVSALLGAGALAFNGAWLAEKIKCAIVGGECATAQLERVYGEDLAELVRRYAPGLSYTSGMLALPTDFRSCRTHRCADAPEAAGKAISESAKGMQATAFTRVIDRRKEGGKLHIQYWFYYLDSTRSPELKYLSTKLKHSIAWNDIPMSAFKGRGAKPSKQRANAGRDIGNTVDLFNSSHRDDWQSYDVAIGPDGRSSVRTTYGNRYMACLSRWCRQHPNAARRWLYLNGGDHTGLVRDHPDFARRRTDPSDIALIPLESLTTQDRRLRFKRTPPWQRPIYTHPDDPGDHNTELD